MTATTIAPTPLVYNGEAINYRDDMLSLTDMWKAAGSPSGRGPSDWRELPETIRFVDFIAEDFIAGKSGNDLFSVTRGGKSPGTWAHWQVGFAYAKYLSPAFHTWCNEVVRERMEHRGVPTSIGLSAREVQLTFRAYQSIGKLIGFTTNVSALAANRATIKKTGVDVLGIMGVTHLLAATQEELLTPTMIGHRLDGLSPQSINKRLEALGYQEAGKDSGGHKTWHPTEKGKPFGQWFDTSKAHKDGTSVLQWKWFATIVDEIRGGVPVAIVPNAQPSAG